MMDFHIAWHVGLNTSTMCKSTFGVVLINHHAIKALRGVEV
jgi:hypothetical protein